MYVQRGRVPSSVYSGYGGCSTCGGFGEAETDSVVPWVPLAFGGIFLGLLIYAWVADPKKSKG